MIIGNISGNGALSGHLEQPGVEKAPRAGSDQVSLSAEGRDLARTDSVGIDPEIAGALSHVQASMSTGSDLLSVHEFDAERLERIRKLLE